MIIYRLIANSLKMMGQNTGGRTVVKSKIVACYSLMSSYGSIGISWS
jgi:hypothetical protein